MSHCHVILAGLAASLLTIGGCTSAERGATSPDQEAPAEAEQWYAEATHDGRIFVLGSQASLDDFNAHHHLPYTRTLIGDGPNGETVVIEVSKKDAEMADRLEAMFLERNPYYREVPHDGRIYVVGSKDSFGDFVTQHHLPYTRTFIGAGPNRETVVFEIAKKDAALVERLVASFNERHGTSLGAAE